MLRLRNQTGIQITTETPGDFAQPGTAELTVGQLETVELALNESLRPLGRTAHSSFPGLLSKGPRVLNGTLRRRLVRPLVVAPPLAPTSFANLIGGDYVAKKPDRLLPFWSLIRNFRLRSPLHPRIGRVGAKGPTGKNGNRSFFPHVLFTS